MGIFSRLADIIHSNINALVDKAEDPLKMLGSIIQEMEDTLVEVRTSTAKSLAEQKRYQRRYQSIMQKQDDWQQKAQIALSKSREDLARAALLEKMRLGELAKSMEEQLAMISEDISQQQTDIEKLQNKLEETRKRQKTLMNRMQRAKSSRKVKVALTPERIDKIMHQLEQVEYHIDQIEADGDSRAQSQEQLLSQNIDKLRVDDLIEAELKQLKTRNPS